MTDIEKLLDVMRRLRDPDNGCPWDLEQDFSTIAPYTIEEAYEVADAIAREDWNDLREELGDLLFQVVFYVQLAVEQGYFGFDEVVAGITDKLVRRHPHVFGDAKADDAGQVREGWEEIKRQERENSKDSSALAGVPHALPALKRAQKIGARAAGVGFDWSDRRGVQIKIREEFEELGEAIGSRDEARVEEEMGDLLFSVVNLARHIDIDAEQALANANRKFERRFRAMEEDLASENREMRRESHENLEQRWRKAKRTVG
jgi:ATP diphosphatase